MVKILMRHAPNTSGVHQGRCWQRTILSCFGFWGCRLRSCIAIRCNAWTGLIHPSNGLIFYPVVKYLFNVIETASLKTCFRPTLRYGTGLGDSDFRVLEVLLHKGPLPVNTVGPIVDLTPGSISIAVDRLVAKGLVSRVESAEDRCVRIVALTARGKDLIVPAFRKHAGQMKRVFSELSPEELRALEEALKKAGKRAAALMEQS
jgi:MarR family transcriptional regulator, 2-MHQ and catechol-resistance regulon repressor